MQRWRYAVITYLRAAAKAAVLDTDLSPREISKLLTSQYERRWIIDVKRLQTKTHVLRYAGRYARRPPIAQHRFRQADRHAVRFMTKDTRTKQMVEDTYGTAEFLTTLADHIPDRYRHNIRYYGLLAPRVKGGSHNLVLLSSGSTD